MYFNNVYNDKNGNIKIHSLIIEENKKELNRKKRHGQKISTPGKLIPCYYKNK